MMERIDLFVQLCKEQPFSVDKIQTYILEHKLNSEEITRAAINLSKFGAYSYDDFLEFNHREPAPQELSTYRWEELFDVLIANGLDPNLVFCDDGSNYENIMESLQLLDDGDLNAKILRKLLQNGGDPNLLIGDIQFFNNVDADFICDSLWGFYPDKRCADNNFQFWLVLFAFGGVTKNDNCPVKLLPGTTVDDFKEFERFDHKVVYIDSESEYEIQIFDRETGNIVATV